MNDSIDHTNKTKKRLTFLLKLAITLAAAYWVVNKISFVQIFALILDSKLLFLFLAIVFFVLSKFLAAIRLHRFVRLIIPGYSATFNLKLYVLGMFYNFFLPGGVGGDGYKVYLLQKKYQPGTKKLISTLLVDRLSGVLLIVFLLAAMFYWIPISFPFKSLVGLIIPLGVLVYRWLIAYFFSYLLKESLFSVGYSFLVQIAQVLSVFFILLSLSVGDSYMVYLSLFLLSVLATVLPISVGGLGVRELTFLIGAQYAGLNVEISVAVGLIFYLVSLLASLPGIYFHFKPGELKV